MEDLKKKKPKHKVVRDSDTGPSPMIHDNADEGTTENNNETSTNDDPTSASNDDQEEGHYELATSNAESAEERSQEEHQLRRPTKARRPSTRYKLNNG